MMDILIGQSMADEAFDHGLPPFEIRFDGEDAMRLV